MPATWKPLHGISADGRRLLATRALRSLGDGFEADPSATPEIDLDPVGG